MVLQNDRIWDADEAMGAMGAILKVASNNILSADRMGWSSGLNFIGSPNLPQTYRTVNPAAIISGNSNFAATNFYTENFVSNSVFIGSMLGSYSSTALWKTQSGGAVAPAITVGSDTFKIIRAQPGSLYNGAIVASGTSAKNFKAGSQNFDVFMPLQVMAEGGSATVYLGFNGGGADVAVWSRTAVNTTITFCPHISVDWGSGLATSYASGATIGSGISIAALSAWYPKMTISGLASTGGGDVCGVSGTNYSAFIASGTSGTYLSTAQTLSAGSVTNAIFCVNEHPGGTGSINWSISTDAGNNFVSATPNEIVRFSNAGSVLVVKGVGVGRGINCGSQFNFPMFTDVFFQYNLY